MLIHGYELDTDEAMEGIMDRYVMNGELNNGNSFSFNKQV